MNAAKSSDLMNWTSISNSIDQNALFKNTRKELAEALAWGQSDTFWAGDWIKLKDGRYYMYYCVCKGDSPQSCIGYAVADKPEGPYTNKGILLKSSGSAPFTYKDANGKTKTYDANVDPNAVDPNVFFDEDGRLWMVYGSYSGGIYILEMNPSTGKPLDGQGYYGKKLLGGYHSEIEAPYIMYSPKTKYYYLFLSYGGLATDGGYNIRVARSKNPDGPYYDSMGNKMTDCKGKQGQFLEAQNSIITKYGTKLIGNYNFKQVSGEVSGTETGYVSPGHNSAYYDKKTGKYSLIFHTRFPNKGEEHQVRVHQMYMNEDGWPVVSPYRYSGETIGKYSKSDVTGEYKFINHGSDITKNIKNSVNIKLNSNGTITGNVTGKWTLSDGNKATITIDGVKYKGVFVKQYDTNTGKNTMTFTVTGSSNGTSLWGSKVVYKNSSSNNNNDSTSDKIVDGATYYIKNVNSGQYLDVQDAKDANNTNIRQFEGNGHDAQKFKLKSEGNGYYSLISQVGSKTRVVDVSKKSTANGANIALYRYTGGKNQQFKIKNVGDGKYTIATRISNGKSMIEVKNASKEVAANVQQWENNSHPCQQWIFERVK